MFVMDFKTRQGGCPSDGRREAIGKAVEILDLNEKTHLKFQTYSLARLLYFM